MPQEPQYELRDPDDGSLIGTIYGTGDGGVAVHHGPTGNEVVLDEDGLSIPTAEIGDAVIDQMDATAASVDQATIGGYDVSRVAEEIYFAQLPSSIPRISIDWSKYSEIIIALSRTGAGSSIPVVAEFGGVQTDGWDLTQRSPDGTFTSISDSELELHSNIRSPGSGLWHINGATNRYLGYGNGMSFGTEPWMVNASTTDDSPPSSDTLDLTDSAYNRVGVWGIE